MTAASRAASASGRAVAAPALGRTVVASAFARAFAAASLATIVALLAACATNRPPPPDTAASHHRLRLLGRQVLPHRMPFDGTIVGGLSGIDRDPRDDRYVLISDDRSRLSPTRFYTARLAIDASGFHDARLETVVALRRPDGSLYPPDAADAEAIRFDPATRTLWWTSEGLRQPARGPSGLIDPFVRRSALDGAYLGEVPLDPMFHITTADRGPRDNLVFEGLTLSADAASLWVAMEAPLLQDGPMPTMRAGAWSRLSRHDRQPSGGFGALALQLAYRIDPIPSNGAWTSAFAQTGVSEILAVDATHLFVLERAFVLGPRWRIRLFEAGLDGATDVARIDSLDAADGTFVPTTKALVLDFDELGVPIDNLEGMCFGPTLPNGHRTLVLVSDDNFDSRQVTELLAFEILPR